MPSRDAIERMSHAELKAFVKQQGWDRGAGGHIALSGAGRNTDAIRADVIAELFGRSGARGASKAVVAPPRTPPPAQYASRAAAPMRRAEETPSPPPRAGADTSDTSRYPNPGLSSALELRSGARRLAERLTAVSVHNDYGWNAWDLDPSPLHSFRETGLLQKTETFRIDTTQKLRQRGVLLPEYVPLVCPSFAARDLASDPNNPKNFDGHDGKAGRDPWSILDYLRDSLWWPQDAIFIDSECFGSYAHRQNGRNRYKNDASIRPWLPTGEFEIEPVDEKNDYLPLRNYRSVFKWAQRVSPVLIFFISREWLASENCVCELETVQDMHRKGLARPDQKVLIVLLDATDARGKPLMPKAEGILRTLRASYEACHEVIDVSPYMDWLESGRKLELMEASRGIQELREALEEALGEGNTDAYDEERDNAIDLKDTLRFRRPDVTGRNVRNRYLPQYQRRVNLNTASVATMVDRLPGIGPVRAENIAKNRKRHGMFESLDDLLKIHGIGNIIVDNIEPFVTLH